ncbi:hypothetical protein [Streptomyces niveus]|uniref:hypothetical protein n=1 Tax=Streptomyces niveus TaxID=193462 RepID=UPI002E2A792C|nr:hypothetical protein [Streptomyces niveus]
MVSLRRAPELWRRVDSTVWYLSLGLLLFAGALVPSLRGHGTVLGGVPDRPYDALAVVAVALQCLPLALCRRWPVICLTLVSTGFALGQLRGYHSFAGTAMAIALLGLGSRLVIADHVALLVGESPRTERRGCTERYGSGGRESSPHRGHPHVARTGDRPPSPEGPVATPPHP